MIKTENSADVILDHSKLRGRIKEIFGTQEKFQKAVGMSHTSLSKKLAGESKFTQSEIYKSAEVLKIKNDEIGIYFFTPKV